MKVNSASSTSASAGSSGPKPAAEGFSQLLGAGGAAPKAAASAVTGATGVSGVSVLLALQGIGGPEARARALRKGRRLLDALDRLQVAMLGDGPTKRHLARIWRRVTLLVQRTPELASYLPALTSSAAAHAPMPAAGDDSECESEAPEHIDITDDLADSDETERRR